MIAHLARRLSLLPVQVVLVTFTVFLALRMTPGDPLNAVMGEKGSPEERERVRREYGLDRPLLEQYWTFLIRAIGGDFGYSFTFTRRPVLEDLKDRFPATLELAAGAMLLAGFFGIALGVVSAIYRGTWIDTATMSISLVGVSIPIFWLGLLLILAFGGWLPTGGRSSHLIEIERICGLRVIDSILQGRWDALGDALRHLALPSLTLATVPLSILVRLTRNSLLEVLDSDYVRTARAKGLSPDAVIMRHALWNAMIPIVTTLGLQFGYLLGGAVLTETVFQWPGLGTYIVDAVFNKDQNCVLAGVTLMTTVFVAANAAVDVSYALIDPRVTHG